MSSDFNFNVISWFLGNVRVKPSLNTQKICRRLKWMVPNWTLLFKKSSSALRTLLYGRKRSAEKVRNFKSTLTGLRIDTEYVIKISFVLSGRKLGSESYRILCNGGPCRKSSSDSSRKSSTESGISSTDSTPKSSLGTLPGLVINQHNLRSCRGNFSTQLSS